MILKCNPEEDSNVLHTYKVLCELNKVILTVGTYDDMPLFGAEAAGEHYAPWLTPAVSHQYTLLSSYDFIKAVEAFVVGKKKDIITETLVLEDQNVLTSDPREALTNNWKQFLWLNSPIAIMDGSYEEYLMTLTSKRRYKLKQAYKQYSFDSDYTTKPVTDEQDAFVKENLRLRFREDKDEYEYALRQWLWFTACSNYGYGIIQEVTEWDILKALTFHIRKSTRSNGKLVPMAYFQGFIKEEDEDDHYGTHLTNIGAFCLAHFMEHLLTEGIRIFDPTCKTSVSESSVDTYKRLVVNTNCVKPVLYASLNPFEYIKPPLFNGEWVVEQEPQILFEGV